MTGPAKLKVLIVFGTRPEAIKMAPVVKEIEKHENYFDSRVCVTAQHREMLDQVLEIFSIIPDYDLDLMRQDQDLYGLSGMVLQGMKSVLEDFSPDLVLVHGDTTSSFFAALAAYYRQIPVGHVEAGLRTGNIYSPWPEEINRKLTCAIAKYHFAPTARAKNNLDQEGVIEQIYITGNTVIDALHMALDIIRSDSTLEARITQSLVHQGCRIPVNKKVLLVTGHRRENFGKGFLQICEALLKLSIIHPEFDIIYPVHYNPNVRKPVYEMLGNQPNIFLIDPLEYLSFVYLMDKSFLVLTDSGGIQEEAPSLGKPVIVMRNNTERPEAVEAGTVILTGTDSDVIVEKVGNLLTNPHLYERMSKAHNPYGDGHAAARIVDVLINLAVERDTLLNQ